MEIHQIDWPSQAKHRWLGAIEGRIPRDVDGRLLVAGSPDERVAR